MVVTIVQCAGGDGETKKTTKKSKSKSKTKNKTKGTGKPNKTSREEPQKQQVVTTMVNRRLVTTIVAVPAKPKAASSGAGRTGAGSGGAGGGGKGGNDHVKKDIGMATLAKFCALDESNPNESKNDGD